MIEDLNDDTAIDAMKDNTTMQVFRDSLIANLVDIYTELMDRAWNYINLDEERQRKVYGMVSSAPSKPQSTLGSNRSQDRYRPLNETSGYRGSKSFSAQPSSPSTGPGTKPSFSIGGGTEGYVDRAGVPRQYVPLNTPREQILSWIKHNNEEIRYPPSLVKDVDRSKFCEFHDGYGHETEECGRLRSEIDKLVCQGRLQHFVVAKEGGSREAQPPAKKTQVTGVINTISGGTLESEYSRKRRKKKQKMVMSVSAGSPWPSIIFGPEDAKGVEFPHEDALIVSTIVGSKWVKRLLVDDGSSVNLLTLSVFLTLGGSKTDLKPVNIPLLGLGGAPVCPEGMVELDLELGVEIPQMDGTEVTSIHYLMMKIPVENEVITIRGNQTLSRQCYMAKMGSTVEMMNIDTPELLLREKKAQKPRENLKTIEITEGSEMCVKLGVDWPNEHRETIIARIKQYVEEFTNKPEDIGGVDPRIISHKLNVDAKCKPVKQKKRTFSLEKQIAIRDEVEKLLKAGFIRIVNYPEWLANVVLIKKSNGKCRLCIDFTDLNNACPKDSFPLPNTDQLVDATCGFTVYAFLDASQGYHQIPMNKDDEEKTAFTTDLGTYCYKKMPFDQLGKNVEVYVDDIVVKSRGIEDHAGDLAKTFEKLKKFNLKLNPEKCVFAVRSGKFLGHLISEKGIEANPEKIEAVMNMKAPNSNFKWTEECNEAFEELKVYLSTPPVLGRPERGEILYLYLSVNDETAAAVLVKEDKVAAEKLRRYFEAHIIVVRTNQPLRKALQRPEMSGRLVIWSVQLGGYDIRYEPRPSLKAQVLEVDGASNLEGSGAGVVLRGPHGVTLRSSVKFDFPASNNAAEYEALLIGLRMVNVVKAEHVTIRSNSQLVVCQILGTFEAPDPEMRRYVDRVKFFLNKIQELGGKWVIEKVPRLENQEADVLAKAATVDEKIHGVHFSVQKHSSIDNHETIFLTQPLENWMQGIAHYLMDGTLPEDRDNAYKILGQAPYYAFLDGVLYRKSFTYPWSRCLTTEEGEYVLREIHEGICGAHIAPRMLAKKAVL
ncbi:uncharacterized protein LOC126681528 [Mercurialis annua]|uniref:uncharacterized protein LOC126681528 n=1 Tax=Mercurialis annua TaxID=3986 RepID=UPI00215EF869|nr:uncharacterized protein LOC126681528 [Mercurialis annua]